MRHKPSKKAGAAKPAPLQIKNVMETGGTSRKGLLLHFTAEQWTAATKGMTELKTTPKFPAALEAAPLPGRPGEFVIGPRCPPGCEPIVRFNRAVKRPGRRGSPVGYTPHPDDFILPECVCPPEIPELPGGGQPGTNQTGCRLVVRFRRRTGTRAVAGPVLTCESTTCTGTCRLASRRLRDGRIQIYCQCRRN